MTNTDPHLNLDEVEYVTGENPLFAEQAREIARGVSARVSKNLDRQDFLEVVRARVEVIIGNFCAKQRILNIHERCEPFAVRTLEEQRATLPGNWESAR